MSLYEEEALDFGEDDDGEFLTGKLAALGIDEDLELSGGEEENEDLTAAVPPTHAKVQAPRTALASSPKYDDKHEHKEGDNMVVSGEGLAEQGEQTAAVATACPTGTGTTAPTARIGNVGKPADDLEEGELLEMINKPLQTSRNPQGYRRKVDSNNDDEGWQKVGGRGRRSGKKRAKSTGRARGRNVTIKECATWVCERLEEPKYYLMCRVVATIGYNTSKRLLDQVRRIQDGGGMSTADGTRKRTCGGVFFTLLKEHIDPAKLKVLYADEVRVKKEKERARKADKKRKAAAADAGEDTMPSRNPAPRYKANFTRMKDMGTWAGPQDGDDAGVVMLPKRARAS